MSTNNEEIIYSTGSGRISSHKQQEGSSLEDQEIQIRAHAKEKGYTVLRIFSTVHSGRDNVRDDFEEVLDYIKEKKAEGIQVKKHIIKSIDRITRNGAVAYLKMKAELRKLGTELEDVRGVIQPEKNALAHLGFDYDWAWGSSTNSAQVAEATKAKDDASDILIRLVGAEIALVKDGYKVRPPNDGFINQKIIRDGKRKVIEVPDPERAHFFRTMFELRAQGVDDKEIVDRINAMGFKSKNRNVWNEERKLVIGTRSGKPLTVKALQRYIPRTIYAGIKIELWTHYKPVMAQYDGLVSIETFNLANKGKVYIRKNDDCSVQVLYNYTNFEPQRAKRLRNNPNFRYKFLPCPICSLPMLGSSSRGKAGKYFSAYHCGGASNGTRAHKYIRISKDEYEDNVRMYLASLRLEQSYLDSFELVLNDVYRAREKEIVSQSSSISFNVSTLKAQQASAIDALMTTTSTVVRKKLEEKVDEIDKQIEVAETQRTEIEVTEKDVKTFVKSVKIIMEHPVKILMETDDMRAQRTLFNLVSEELPTYEEILNGTPKLSLAFKLSENYKVDKSQLVTLQRIEL